MERKREPGKKGRSKPRGTCLVGALAAWPDKRARWGLVQGRQKRKPGEAGSRKRFRRPSTVYVAAATDKSELGTWKGLLH